MARISQCYNVADLRLAARRRLPKGILEFIDRGTEDEVALFNNIAAFQRVKLSPKVLVDVSKRTLSTALLGKPVEFPVAIAPTAMANLCWYEGEIALARAASNAGIPFALSSGATTSMEKIADAAGGRLWFQLSMWQDRTLSYDLVKRARAAPFEALILTVDNAVSPKREYNIRNGFSVPFTPNLRSLLDMATHPAWLSGVLMRYLSTTGMPRHENYPAKYRARIDLGVTPGNDLRSDSVSWDDVRRLRDIWPGLLILKGIQRGDDARRAVEYGANAVIVSNHGGRQLDCARATFDILPDVVRAVGDTTTIMLDGGIRRGSDILKALAVGAKAVLVGRAALYGVAVAGQAGAELSLNFLREELDRTMAFAGCCRVDELDLSIVEDERFRSRSGDPLPLSHPAL
jgi:(S)-mandelate dehydrogenase